VAKTPRFVIVHVVENKSGRGRLVSVIAEVLWQRGESRSHSFAEAGEEGLVVETLRGHGAASTEDVGPGGAAERPMAEMLFENNGAGG
jgi:hypothetical protein